MFCMLMQNMRSCTAITDSALHMKTFSSNWTRAFILSQMLVDGVYCNLFESVMQGKGVIGLYQYACLVSFYVSHASAF